ncbi:MAG TPA: DNA repair and recombination protein RadB [Candidatus Nanoarchaeia archaeon]|nr:DNA repair and recombination protein RadB [Candidatus Nanoarchaeia archaeon]
MTVKLSTGSEAFDHLLGGGIEQDVVTTVYGPAGSGKTNLAILCAVQVAGSGKKVIFVDTEGGFSVERLKQIVSGREAEIMGNILFLNPVNFEEQKQAFEKLRKITNEKIGLIVIDGIAMHYRLEMGRNPEQQSHYLTNKELALQIGYLTEIARMKRIPVLVTNQVYSSFEMKDKVNMVGGDIVLYGSKCLIELQKANSNKRLAIIRKHRALPESRSVLFEIVQEGIRLVSKEASINNPGDIPEPKALPEKEAVV